jgi:uncharacterized membrane protein YhhN
MFLMVLCLGDGGGSYSSFIGSGLIGCGIGDVFTELEYAPAASTQEQPFFLCALIASLVGHSCYVCAFLTNRFEVTLLTALPAVAYGIAVFVLLHPHLPSTMVVPILTYTVVVGTMLVLSYSRKPDGYAAIWSSRCSTSGALLFAASNTLLAFNKYVVSFPNAKLLWSVTYYIGQYALAMSARGAQPRRLSSALGSVEDLAKSPKKAL